MAKVKFPRRKRETHFTKVYQTETIYMTQKDVEDILRLIPKEERLSDYVTAQWSPLGEPSLFRVSFVMTSNPEKYGLPVKGIGMMEI